MVVSLRVKVIVPALLIIAGLAATVWATDWITLEGERTIYTADCVAGSWTGLACSGSLVPGARHRFRASRVRGEVVHWIAGSTAPSGKMTQCEVKNRENWSCKVADPVAPAIGRTMTRGRLLPVAGTAGEPVHAIAKWKWWAMHVGVGGFSVADY